MDFLDYREALGLAFCEESKFDYFLKKVFNILNIIERENFAFGCMSSNEYCTFFNSIGELINTNYSGDDYSLMFSHALSILRQHTGSIGDFLSYYIPLANSFEMEKEDPEFWTRKNFVDCLTSKLEEAHIPYDLLEDDNQQFFVFPKGAKDLDDALVSQPLEWLKQYPEAEKAWVKALKSYTDATEANASDVADLFRKTLEAFFREFFKGNKSLENYKKNYGDYLKGKGVPAEISNNLETLLQAYTNFMNNFAKHRDATSDKVLEYLMYQTGNIIRLLITLEGQS